MIQIGDKFIGTGGTIFTVAEINPNNKEEFYLKASYIIRTYYTKKQLEEMGYKYEPVSITNWRGRLE